MKVYVCYHCGDVVKIVSSEEKAKAWLNDQEESHRPYYEYEGIEIQ